MKTNTNSDASIASTRLAFEVLISDLSARFVNIPPKLIDMEIEGVLDTAYRTVNAKAPMA